MRRRILLIIVAVVIFLFFFTKFKMNQSNPEVLLPMISEIEQKIQFRDQKNNEVSKVTVAWHLDHMLKTINQISKALEHSDPSAYKSTFNVPRIMSLTAGFIPRGRAESPQSVRPPEIILTKDIHTQILVVKEAIEKLKTLDEHANFDHPVFGMLDKAQTIRFLEVHTEHHLKIVADIMTK